MTEIPQFIVHNWYLFAALVVVLALLLSGFVMPLLHRVQTLSPSETVLAINRDTGVVVDIRDANDFRAGHVIGALNLPLAELKDRARELEKYKNRTLIVVCRSGERGLKGAVLLRRLGFAAVCVLAGGMAAWERGQMPIEK